MRFDTAIVRFAFGLASLASVASAWPDPPSENALYARQNDNNNNEESSSEDADRSTITDPPTSRNRNGDDDPTSAVSRTRGGNDEGEDGDDLNTARPSKTGGKSDTKKSEPTRTKFAADAPAGGVSMISPATTIEPTPLYKIGDNVEFKWNYTSLKGKPSAVDVIASCSFGSRTWTLTSNMSFATDASYFWDTKEQGNDPEDPLLTEMYTLIIKDSDAEITDIPDPGYLGTYSQLTFGLYERKQATPYADWKCVGCSDAPSLFERPALTLAFTMSLVTLISFTWFVTGLGLQ